jgi:phage tail tube protein FII
MKKLVLTIATSLFISGLTMAMVGPSGDNNDESTATHSVEITIPTVALVDVESTAGGEAGTINLSPTVSSLEAGEAVDFGTATNSDLWLNYTSIVEGNGNNAQRRITVELDNENKLPSGISLLVSAGTVSSGKGKKGSPAEGKVTLGKNAQDLITGIGSCYTESGSNKGHNLTYELSMDNDKYEKLMADTYDVQITYTITGE